MTNLGRLLAAAAATAILGCNGAPAVVGEDTASLSTAFANDKAAYDYFVGKGLTSFQSAGIVGNLDQESGVDPSSVQYGGGPGRGIAQWSVGGRWDSSSQDNVLWYAGTKGASSTSLDLQLDFIWYELTTFGYGFSNLKAAGNVGDATVVFMSDYEICGTCDQTQRIAYAQSVLAAYGTTPDWSAKYVSQSWPLATTAMKIKCGESVAANIVLKNAGGKSWTSETRLGTTQPRDRKSIFAGSDWIGADRAATSGGVAPSGDGKFAFAFHGPTGAACKPGTYKEFFGVVQEGVAWFSDAGQGGPADDQIEALIDLVAADAPGGGTPSGNADGGASGDGGQTAYGGGGNGPAGSDDGGSSDSDGGTNNGDHGGGNGNGVGGNGENGGTSAGPVAHNGCDVGGGGSDGALVLACIMLAAAMRRRRA
jgi:hypothetical protein